jgi:chemotaxis regulatin CheY-phosphate phosphatase CheZ
MENYLTMNSATMEGISTSQSEILSLQSYQDLTSQAISKAESLLNNLEANLTELLSDFSRIKNIEVIALPALQPQVEANPEPDEADPEYLAQDEVDALLSKLGF